MARAISTSRRGRLWFGRRKPFLPGSTRKTGVKESSEVQKKETPYTNKWRSIEAEEKNRALPQEGGTLMGKA